jgi:DNA-binding response OmpR family regulator
MVNCIVVDDDQDIVELFCDMLKMIDVDVLATSNNGKDIAKIYKKFQPDIVFTDLQMPKYDGYYVVETIKDLDVNAKIIVITGDLNARYVKLFDLLNIPIITKPFKINEIKQMISDVSLTKPNTISPFEIQYRFHNDINTYSCTVTYAQYRNFMQLPIVQECKILETHPNAKINSDEMQKAFDMAIQNDTSHIRKLSEVVQK